MPPRAKRPRTTSPSPSINLDDPGTSASHLVSFLTGYDQSSHQRDIHADGNDHDNYQDDSDDDDVPGRSRRNGVDEDGYPDEEDLEEDDDVEEGVEEEEDPDADLNTPTKRRTGLVGTPGKSSPSSRSAPRSGRSKKATPRKKSSLDPLELLRKRIASGASPSFGEEDSNGQGGGIIRISKADEYFLQAYRPSKTSGNSYSSLVKPLTQGEYESYTSKARSTGSSSSLIQSLQSLYKAKYSQWELELSEGFNLLFYGFGSKRSLLNDFATQRLAKLGNIVIINGHFPGLGIREILDHIENGLSIPPANSKMVIPAEHDQSPIDRLAYRLYTYFLPSLVIPKSSKSSQPTSSRPLFLVIHNIDAPGLRNPKAQNILGMLASNPNIHIIASFDHIHTPLIFSSTISNSPPHNYTPGSWDGKIPTGRGFQWIYHNITTYSDYDLELTYQRLSASSGSNLGIGASTTGGQGGRGGISEEGALQILRSVPPMALRLLKLLLSKQLSNLPPDPKFHVAYHPGSNTTSSGNSISPIFGVEYDILQNLAREKFIAREEERFNSLLGEFRDHGLVVEAVFDQEGKQGRWVWVPLGKAAVERVLDSMKGVQA